MKQGINILLTLILANLLTPEAFGIFATVTIISGYALVLIDFGFSSAIIQDKNISNQTLSSIFWSNIFIGLSLTIIAFTLAPFIANFYSQQSLTIYIRAISSIFIISSFNIVHIALLQKNLKFKLIAIYDILPILISGILAVYLANLYKNSWPLVIQLIVQYLINLFIVWIFSPWKPNMYFSFSDIKKYGSYISAIFFNNTFKYLTENLDLVVTGRTFGQATLGIYRNSLLFINLPGVLISSVLTKVFFPIFSRNSDNEKYIVTNFLKLNRIVSFTTFPLMFLLFAESELLIKFILGDKWIQAIPYIKVFSFAGMFRSLNSLVGSVYLSMGHSKIIWQDGIMKRSLIIVSISIGSFISIWWLAVFRTVAELVNLLISFYNIHRSIGIPIKTQVFNVGANFLLAMMTGSILLVIMQQYVNYSMLYKFIFYNFIGLLVFFSLQFLFNKKMFYEFTSIVKLYLTSTLTKD